MNELNQSIKFGFCQELLRRRKVRIWWSDSINYQILIASIIRFPINQSFNRDVVADRLISTLFWFLRLDHVSVPSNSEFSFGCILTGDGGLKHVAEFDEKAVVAIQQKQI